MTDGKSGAPFAVATMGIALFTIMDAVMKGLSFQAGAYNAVLWRMAAGVLLSAIPYVLWWRGWPSRAAMRIHIHRGVVGAVSSVLFFWGLERVPMAQAVALGFVAPLFTLFLAAVLLDERISRHTIAASLIAFAGVLTILAGHARAELGHAAFLGAIAVLLSAIFYAYNLILMRRQSQLASGVEVSFFHTLTVLCALLLAAPVFGRLPAAEHLPDILLAGVLGTGSIFLMSWAYARAEANYLAPVEYTAFIWASILGYVVFAEKISLLTVIGAIMIVGACLAATRRQPEPMANLDGAL